jgi:hypothetical protein
MREYTGRGGLIDAGQPERYVPDDALAGDITHHQGAAFGMWHQGVFAIRCELYPVGETR